MQAMKILLIEEDVISREVLSLILSEKCNLTALDNIDDAEKEITSADYNIILLDLDSNKYDGLALCKIVASHSLSSPPLVIALGNETAEEKIRAIFEAGAYDYFVKPYNVVLFYESLLRLTSTIAAYQELEENDKSARDTLGIALTQASYYGFAFDLLSEIHHTKTIESLAQTVLSGLSSRGIHCALQITDINSQISTYEEDKDVVGERTLQVFNFVRDQGRIFRFGRRLVFNDEHVSLFVKSMDDVSDLAYDCVLDIGAKLIPCIEEQFFVVSEHLLLTELQDDTKTIVDKLQLSLRQQASQTENIRQNVAGSISMSFDQLEMTEAQESFFLELIATQLEVESVEDDFEDLET